MKHTGLMCRMQRQVAGVNVAVVTVIDVRKG
jgi:hypothetical protein